jgi:hypothetical protein
MVEHELQFGQLPSPFGHPTVPASRPLHSFLVVSEQLYELLSAQETVHREGRPCSAQYEGLLLGCRMVDQAH